MSQSNSLVRWALVTGASAGIGAAFARELARRSISLVLTARREDRLVELARELSSAYPIRVETIASDLADPAAPENLQAEIQRRAIDIDWLVNNAGYGVPGAFVSQPWRKHAEFIQVLMTAPCHLAHLFLPAMQQRRYGRVINVASLAGHLPGTTGHTLYAASKAYMVKFSQSLHLENRGNGVHACAVCPGMTYSEFHDVTGAREKVSKLPAWMWMDAATVARQGIDAVERGDAVFINGRANQAIKALFKLLPDSLGLRLIERRSRDFRVLD